MTTALIPLASFNISGVAMTNIRNSGLYQDGESFVISSDNPAAHRARAALRAAVRRRIGAGVTYVVTVDLVGAGPLWDYCWTAGSALVRHADAETRKDGRALLAVAERIGICCVKARWGKPTPQHGPVPPEGVTPVLFTPAVRTDAEPVVMSRVAAVAEADRRNATGDVSYGCLAAAQPHPAESWGGHDNRWTVVEVATGDGSDPVRARRNLTGHRDPRHWNGTDHEFALLGSVGEPVRTWEDMRLALSAQMQRYLRRFPDPAGPVEDGLAYRVACLITGDHYTHPGTVMIRRGQLLTYVGLARAAQPPTP